MLTGMTQDDWTVTLKVFDAAQSRRGEPGHDDRRFLEAVHFFTVHTITWRALPAEFGNGNSVWKRFWRLSRTGVFEPFFELLAQCSDTAHLAQMFDNTVVRADVSAAGAKGAANQALGRSRSGSTDFNGLPIGFHLTGREVRDTTQFETSKDIGPDIKPRAAITDKGYDSQANRAAARKRGIFSSNSLSLECQKQAQGLTKKALQDQGAHRASYRQAEAVQTDCPAMRESSNQLLSIRRLRFGT